MHARRVSARSIGAPQRVMRWVCALVALVVLFDTDIAAAVTHLVQPGERWSDVSPKVRAGDEILLLPGKHRAAVLTDIAGSAEQPVVVRSLDPDRPAVITGERHGLVLRRCRGIIVENLLITGARHTGILIDGGEDVSLPPDLNEFPPGQHIIRNVAINRTGPEGPRHSVEVRGQREVLIESCTFQGWGGAGVWIGHSEDVTVDACQFRRLPGFGHAHGVYICGGTDDVRIRRNFIDDSGTYGVKIGDRLRVSEFGSRVMTDIEPGTLYDASRVVIEQNVIRGTECAISLSHTDRCHVRSNTIVSPRQIAFSLMHNHLDPRFGDHHRGTVSSNLIVAEIAPAPRGVVVLKPLERTSIAMGVNLWWSPDIDAWRAALAKMPIEDASEQTTDMNPDLDVSFTPRLGEAQMFGAATEGIPILIRAASANGS